MRNTWRRTALLALVCAGCADTMEPLDAAREPGVLQVEGWRAAVPTNTGSGNVRWPDGLHSNFIAPAEVIVAPDTVEAGQPFEIATFTIGISGCWRSDGQTVTTMARTVVLRPYDSHSGSELCTGALVILDHRSTAVLGAPGEWTLRVHGRRLRLGDQTWSEPITAERSIFVR